MVPSSLLQYCLQQATDDPGGIDAPADGHIIIVNEARSNKKASSTIAFFQPPSAFWHNQPTSSLTLNANHTDLLTTRLRISAFTAARLPTKTRTAPPRQTTLEMSVADASSMFATLSVLHPDTPLHYLLNLKATLIHSDIALTCIILTAVPIWLGLWQQLTAAKIIPSTITRKIIHISCGPAFIALWPFFTNAPTARLLAAVIPVLFTFALFLTGSSSKSNDNRGALGRAISRRGNASEALQGPLYYTLVLLSVTLLLFKSVAAAIAVMQLCVGDGMAELAGRRFGKSCPWNWGWTGDKSVAGSAAFAVSAFVASCLAVFWFNHFNVCGLQLGTVSTISSLLMISIACAAIELAPLSIVGDDNVAISVTAVVLSYAFFGATAL